MIRKTIFILTGGPCAGKTTTLARIAGRGLPVIAEAAAEVIIEGRIHPDREPLEFQREVLRRQIQAEESAPPGIVFADRGIGDHFGYLEHYRRIRGIGIPGDFLLELESAWTAALRRYPAVFLLEQGPVFSAAAYRRETPDTARAIHGCLAEAYRARHSRLVLVPWGPQEERVEAILAAAREALEGTTGETPTQL